MPKQIKIGFDKIPSPEFPTFEPLYDIDRGVQLVDSAGNTLLTNVSSQLTSFSKIRNSASISVNNGNGTTTDQSLKIEEQFPETSQVSVSLLGVPRSEVQLSLFADVSTYGYDPDNWEYYTFQTSLNYPEEWYARRNPIYGPRTRVEFVEKPDEQALVLTAFPTQYSYPFGPRWGNSGGAYNEISFKLYMNFIALGKLLYDYFYNADAGDPLLIEELQQYAKNNFLNEDIKIVDEDGLEVPFTIDLQSGLLTGTADFYDVIYGDNPQLSFDQIERFTLIYESIIAGTYNKYPYAPFTQTLLFSNIELERSNRRPGYSGVINTFGVLESKDVFRYQPGRISGFTFGVRANASESEATIIEWGCSNSTDQYMFQIRGSKFNIIRRSTIPLGSEIIENRLRLEPNSEKLIYIDGLENSVRLWETVIPRDKFNGDPLDGNGNSGYTIDLKKVTMFKIEFGWYGAIGARFYAYIPSGSGEARWVVLHTLVIENGIDKPCLANPEFKFRYFLNIKDNSTIKEPVYINKYGASYYIDGGDEGTVKLYSATTETKEFSTNTPIMGIIPKENIFNSQNVPTKNQILLYPTSINVRTDELAKINFQTIIGSPDGFHFNYSPSLHNDKGSIQQITIVNSGSGYVNGTYSNIPTTGGAGIDAKLNITVSGGTITQVLISDSGSRYNKNDLLFVSNSLLGGTGSNLQLLVTSVEESKSKNVTLTIIENGTKVQLNDKVILQITNGGSNYTNGTYYNVPLSGGTGQYLTIDATVINGTVSYIRVRNDGDGLYSIDDILTLATTALGFGTGFSATIVDIDITNEFTSSDYFRKIIADGVYNAYIDIDPSNVGVRNNTAIIRRTSYYDLINRPILQAVKLASGEILENIYNIPFYATLTGLNDTVLKCQFPIKSSKFAIHFLNPNSRDPSYNRHWADFSIGVTDKELLLTDVTDELDNVIDKKFIYTVNEVDYDFDILSELRVKWSQGNEQLSINGEEISEWDRSYGIIAALDPRLPNPLGVDSGIMSKINGEVVIRSYLISEIIPQAEPNVYKLYFVSDTPTILPEEVNYVTFGLNNEPTNIVAISINQTETSIDPDTNNELVRNYIFVSGTDAANLEQNAELQTRTVVLRDGFKIRSFDNNGNLRFADRFFTLAQNINFSSSELTLVVGMNDYAKINGIVIEELTPNGNINRNPIWQSNLLIGNNIVVNSGNSSDMLTPSTFSEITRLSSAKIDTQSLQPLRPGVSFHSFFVSPNINKPIDLSSVFGRDRNKLTPGLKNNTAMFITANSLNNAGEIEISVNIKEQ